MRFDYPSLDNKKRTHDLLKHLRTAAAEAKKLSKNQQRLIKKPDHFVDLLTGDHAKQLHEKRTKVRKHNQKEVVNNVYQNYEFDCQKAVLQASSHRKSKYFKTCIGDSGLYGAHTNGASLQMREQHVDVPKQKRELRDALTQQMQRQRSEKDMEVISKFTDEVRHNQRMQQLQMNTEQLQTAKKLQQRDELRREMQRVLEMKRLQKLRATEEEFKYYL